MRKLVLRQIWIHLILLLVLTGVGCKIDSQRPSFSTGDKVRIRGLQAEGIVCNVPIGSTKVFVEDC